MTNEDVETNPRGTMERLKECRQTISAMEAVIEGLSERVEQLEGQIQQLDAESY